MLPVFIQNSSNRIIKENKFLSIQILNAAVIVFKLFINTEVNGERWKLNRIWSQKFRKLCEHFIIMSNIIY